MDGQQSLYSDFVRPDPSNAPVPLWWWDGEDLDDDRLTDQLETLAEGGIGGVCVLHKHPTGYAGDEVTYFGEDWWNHLEHVAAECVRLDLDLWMHDQTYHHSPPNHRKYWQNWLEVEAGSNTDLRGKALRHVGTDAQGGDDVDLAVPETVEPISAAAYPLDDDGRLVVEQGNALEIADDATTVQWTPPDDGRTWHVGLVGRESAGLRYTTREAVDRYLDLHFEEYDRRLDDAVGDAFVGTFEDELVLLQPEYPHDLTINVPGDDRVLERFRAVHEYDPVPELVTLFEDAGENTARLRADYYDVVTTLLEECWFEPLYEYHEDRDLVRAHDNFGRLSLAKQTIQYTDYMRTMRWYQAPGYDDGNIDPKAIETIPDIPIGERNFFDARLAASVAAAYERPRVWGELFHSTGWGYRPEKQLAGIAENVCYGMNLYDKHGLYYSTVGGWWEHAPPDTHFRQPYWDHIEGLNDAATRLCGLFRHGRPGFDVALFYPASTMQAQFHPTDGVDDLGHELDDRTRELLDEIYHDGRNPVFLDRNSLVRAETDSGRLRVGEVDVPALVLGPTTVLRSDSLAAVRSFYDDGGVVVAVGRLPRTVAGDEEQVRVDTLEHVFGTTTVPESGYSEHSTESGGLGLVVSPHVSVASLLDEHVGRGIETPDGIYHGCRHTEDGDVYLLLNTESRERTETVRLPTEGHVERWNVFDGTRRPVAGDSQDGSTTVELSFAPYEHHILVVGDQRGDCGDRSPVPAGTTAETTDRIDIEGDWSIKPRPTLHNEWGDFRYPADDSTLLPEIRTFEHRVPTVNASGLDDDWYLPGDDDGWETIEWSHGPYFWRAVADDDDRLQPPSTTTDGWEPYVYSTVVGDTDEAPKFGGLVGRVSEEFLVAPDEGEEVHFWTTVCTEEEGRVICHYGPTVERLDVGDRTIVGSTAIPSPGADTGGSTALGLPSRTTPIRLVVEPGTSTYLAFERPPSTVDENRPADVPRLPWFDGTETVQFDSKPWSENPVGWYRFEVPPGTRSVELSVFGEARVWVAGEEHSVEDGRVELDPTPREKTMVSVRVAQQRGRYGGAAWAAPIELDVGPAPRPLDDWRQLGFGSYSGQVRYEKTVSIPDIASDERLVLDLGDVSVSAAVSIDGTSVGTRFAPPYRFDLTEFVTPGPTDLTVDVANTIANHLADEVPTDYVYDEIGQLRAGLFGPVSLLIDMA